MSENDNRSSSPIVNYLFDRVKKSSSKFQVLSILKDDLIENGFVDLQCEDDWQKIKSSGKYYFEFNRALFTFVMPKTEIQAMNIVNSHIDSPTFRIKHNSVIFSEGYITLNTESYGGAILSSWLDRPISIAGRVCLTGKNSMTPKILDVDLKDYTFVIPNIAIHLNREINEGFKYNKQSDMLPIVSLMSPDKVYSSSFLYDLISTSYNVEKSDILDFDLYLYQKQAPIVHGVHSDMILSPKLDNLQSVFISNKAISEVESNDNTLFLNIYYDNEEIGSETSSGADSSIFTVFFNKLKDITGFSEFDVVKSSFAVSCDATHAKHPSGGALQDPTNAPVINSGVVIKQSASGNYSSDGFGSAVVVDICRKNSIPYQFYSTRSDKKAGSTLGPIFSSKSAINSVDIGLSLLAMHSTMETGGVKDCDYLFSFLKCFYS